MAKFLFIIQPFIIDPLGIAYLSKSLKDGGHDVRLLRTDDPGFNGNIEIYHPDFICYSVTTGNHAYYIELNQKLKRTLPFKFTSLFGGPHCTYFPEMVKESGVDLICVGDGEYPIRELADRHPVKLHSVNIKNIHSKYCKNETQAHPSKFHMPDRDTIYSYPDNRLNPIKNVMTMRGCLFDCPYCYNYQYHKLFGRGVTFYDIDNVMRDLHGLKGHWGAKFIWFEDDMFICNRQRLKGMLRRYKNEIALPFHCQVRVEFVDDDMAALLKLAGCVSVTFAIESGNDYIRMNLLDRRMTKDQIHNCCNILKRHGILYRTENMVGLPGETIKQAMETLNLNYYAKPTLAWCSVYQPYPRTKLGELSGFTGADGFCGDFFTTSPLKTKYRKQFDRLQKIFALAVRYKFIKMLVPVLINLPLGFIYKPISLWYKKRMYDTQLYKF